MIKLEVCCYSAECAIAAEQAGADRIELCSSPTAGGLTPSFETLKKVHKAVRLPVHPIVRPRGSNFTYSSTEFRMMLNEIAKVRDMGFPGLAIGLLDGNGRVDLARMRRIVYLAGTMEITFHRAFDVCSNPYEALRQLTDLGVFRILSSGQQENAEKGLCLLKELTEISRGPIIMAGAGIRLTNLHKFIESGIKELHTSASYCISNNMHDSKFGVSTQTSGKEDKFNNYKVNVKMVANMKKLLTSYSSKKVG